MTTVAAVPTEAEWGTATPEQRTNWRSLHPGTPHPPHIQTTAPDDEAALSARCCVDTPPWPAAEWEASLRPGGVDPPSSITRLPTAVAAVHYVARLQDGQSTVDSSRDRGEGQPVEFILGNGATSRMTQKRGWVTLVHCRRGAEGCRAGGGQHAGPPVCTPTRPPNITAATATPTTPHHTT